MSTIIEETDTVSEHAVFGTGFGNSLVVVARRLLMTGQSDSETTLT
ncbi:MAG: hypothetical protein ABEH56_03530 [Salinirussus sp.]